MDRQVQNKTVGIWGRSVHTEPMGKASHDAVLDLYPKERSFVLTRSATAKILIYAASSWGSENETSWASIKGANPPSLNAGFSLLQVQLL
ncbi:hypothetical protein BJ878DRAFT_518681 [Calycina marina]|uniref:Glycoside hydrolase family 31 TIM barrel domain-containing protein n=1 Tax=Calycina marina TaxID=1763456 RepID=A0A9P7YYP7_9HELO|nr:hypothetical protein BJ878DRAFT_518681 [Calycina marina]